MVPQCNVKARWHAPNRVKVDRKTCIEVLEVLDLRTVTCAPDHLPVGMQTLSPSLREEDYTDSSQPFADGSQKTSKNSLPKWYFRIQVLKTKKNASQN